MPDRCLFCVNTRRPRTAACGSCEHPNPGGEGKCQAAFCTVECPTGSEPHGWVCGCTCRMQICEAHADDHLEVKHKSDEALDIRYARCYTIPAAIISSGTMAAAEQRLADDSDGFSSSDVGRDALQTVHSFLNVVTPGPNALREAQQNRRPQPFEEDADVWGHVGRPYLRLRPEAFTATLAERVFALAARQLGRAWIADRIGTEAVVKLGSGTRRTNVLAAFGAFARISDAPGMAGRAEPLDTEALISVLPLETPLTTRRRLAIVLSAAPPTLRRDIAEWVTDVRASTGMVTGAGRHRPGPVSIS